jgi:hypothetical protein
MRQNNDPSNKGKNAQPLNRALTLAGQLSGVHHVDVQQTLQILTEFARAEMRDASFASPTGGTHSEAEELGATLIMVRNEVDAESFTAFLHDYVRLLGMVRTFLTRQGGNTLAIAEIDRITKGLAVEEAVITDPAPVRRAGIQPWLKSKAVIVAAIALALHVWDISSDGLMLWQIIAAIGLVGCIGGAAFRIGQRLQTPVTTSPVAADTTLDHTVGH